MTPATVDRSSPRRLAIIGGGPRGLFALERLLLEVENGCNSVAIQIDVFEPSDAPGAGTTYDPERPDFLRMNFAAEHVDLWSRDQPSPLRGRHALVDWLAVHDPAWAEPEAFVPRARVGAYLADGYRTVVAALEARGIEVMHIRASVASVKAAGSRWRVVVDRPSHADGHPHGQYDDVLLCLGHTASRRDAFRSDWADRLDHEITFAFPTSRLTDLGRIPPGSRVAIRGFALTWIDATLALFEGRGGSFEGDPHHEIPRYVPSGNEVAVVWPFSRGGRPLAAKPDPRRFAQIPDSPDFWHRDRACFLAIHGQADVQVASVIESLIESAARALSRIACDPSALGGRARAAVRAELRERLAAPAHAEAMTADQADRSLRKGFKVAVGASPPDAVWALGEAWRQLYPAVVTCVSYGGLPIRQRPTFRHLAAEMERVAFGPPAFNVAKMLSLVDAGYVDLRYVVGPRLVPDQGKLHLVSRDGHRSAAADAVVDAVLPVAGCDERSPVLGPLLSSGHVRHAAGTMALETTTTARAIAQSGTVTPGLAVAGRAVEGWVIGHDTLSRRMHAELAGWATEIVENAARNPAMTGASR